MKIPTVTDEMLERVLEACPWPVLIEWASAGDERTFDNAGKVQVIFEEFDGRVLFLRVWIDENPSAFWKLAPSIMSTATYGPLPCVTLYHRNRYVGAVGDIDVDELRHLIDHALGRAA